jgi:hypothetical protein
VRIGLWNLEPKIENTALMQVSQYHKQKGDSVELYSPLFSYDKVYVFSLFSFTKKPILAANMKSGGTGFNVVERLPPEIERCNLDYSACPTCQTSYLWFSRGCIRNCPFCVVPTKEGALHCVEPKNINPKGKTISVMDNTFSSIADFYARVNWLSEQKLPVDFQCGLDTRLPHKQKWQYIKNNLKIFKQIRTAWDNPRDDLTHGLSQFAEVFGKYKIMVFVLIGYWSTPEEDLMRVTKIRDLGLDPWVMPYNKQDPYQKAFERWANRHIGCEWPEYAYGRWKPELLVPEPKILHYHEEITCNNRKES